MSLRRQLTRNNHYVPRAVLRRWSTDGTHIHAYRTLVAAERIPEWLRMPVKGVAYQRDLYTQSNPDGDLDDFERMVAEKYEGPGLRSIERVLTGVRLTSVDWRNIGHFVACQDVRTPASLVEEIQKWNRDLPEFLSKNMQETIDEMESAVRGGPPPTPHEQSGAELKDVLRVHIEKIPTEQGGGAWVKSEIVGGRKLWLSMNRHLLGGIARVFAEHRWGIYEPFGDTEWPLTDRPVLKLNWYGEGKYDFKGGWGNPKGDIMMPLSPRKLLHVEVGRRCTGKNHVMSKELTELTQRLLCENAFRWIFATKPIPMFAEHRPRVVSRDDFEHEEAEWLAWHRDQGESELS